MGGRAGVTKLDSVDGLLVQATLEAVTVKVYVVPLDRPVTVAFSVEPSTDAVSPPGADVAVYWVMALPPSSARRSAKQAIAETR